MAQIRKEIPTWDINWTNRVFTLANDVDFIDDLWFDGAIYTSFSRNGRVLTLTDAPNLSIYVDYQTANTVAPIDTTCTTWDVIGEIYNLMWQTPNSTNFNRNRVLRKINSINERIWKGRVTSLLDKRQTFRAGKLWFQESMAWFRIQNGSALTSELNIWDNTAEMDTEFLLPAWYVQIGADIIRYTAKTDTAITWISGVTTQHLIEERVVQLYEAPVNLFKPIEMIQIVQGTSDLRTREIPFRDEEDYTAFYKLFRVTQDGDTIILLKIQGLRQDDQVRLTYANEFISSSNDTDICPFPSNYAIDVTANLVAWEFMYQRRMPNGAELLNDGYSYLQNMYEEYTNEIRVIKQSIRPNNYPFYSVGRRTTYGRWARLSGNY